MKRRRNRHGPAAAAAVLGLTLVLGLVPRGRGDSPSNGDETGPGAAATSAASADRGQTIDPLSVNATCYVCHMTFVREPISRVHFAKKVTCIECHGVSAGHANDEDIGGTKPDRTYRRNEVDTMCARCHKSHDAPARDVVARFLERKPAGPQIICTDCHGHHRIESVIEGE